MIVNDLVVDCSRIPNISSCALSLDGERTEHRAMGILTFENRNGKLYADDIEIIRYLPLNLQNGNAVNGHELRKELEEEQKQVLNACVFDALITHPKLIPDSWRIGHTYFWGTVFNLFRFFEGKNNLVVKFLYWAGMGWDWRYGWLDDKCHMYSFAACLAIADSTSEPPLST